MSYTQITSDERYMISTYHLQGWSDPDIALKLRRHRSTIGREIKRNKCCDGAYRPSKADRRTRARRSESRKHWYFQDSQLQIVASLLRLDWSPEQVSGWLRVNRIFLISHTTIYRYVWYDRYFGGQLHTHLRQAGKKRKRYRADDSRGVLPGKRHISQRPLSADSRSRFGHWEIDTVAGANDRHCIVTLVERRSRFIRIGKLSARTTAKLNRRVISIINSEPRTVRSITADNGTEFHAYKLIEAQTHSLFFFANPYHSYERGLNENSNGLVRQYLPKGHSMANLSQPQCDAIAQKLNRRPRKSLAFKTPEQCYAPV